MQIHHRIAHHAHRFASHVRERYDAETIGAGIVILALVGVFAYQFGLNAGRRDAAELAGVENGVPSVADVASQFDVFITATSTGVTPLAFHAPKAAEVVRRGTTYTLKWKGIGYEGYAAADILLTRSGGEPVKVNDANAFVDIATGVYAWKVPADIELGSYTLSVEIMRIFKEDDAPEKIAEARSGAFLITE